MRSRVRSLLPAAAVAILVTFPTDRCLGQFGGFKIPTPKIDVPKVRIPSVPDIGRKASEAGRHVEGKAKEAIRHVDRDLKNLDQKRLEYQRYVLLPQASSYHAYLEGQANGRLRTLPEGLKQVLAPHYRDFDLGRVRYAERINTIHGQGITVGYNIYFPRSIDLNNKSDLHWMLHELEHVSQYRAHGGVEAFTFKYLINGGLEGLRQRGVNVHDNIGLERDAENKADRIFKNVWDGWQLTQGRVGNQQRPGQSFPIPNTQVMPPTQPFPGSQPSIPNRPSFPPSQAPPRQPSDGERIAGAIIQGIEQAVQQRQQERRARPPIPDVVQQPRLGLNVQQVPGRGALVTSVSPGGLGAQAGIEVNDYVVAINGHRVETAQGVLDALRQAVFSGQRSAAVTVENHRLGHLPFGRRYASVNVSW